MGRVAPAFHARGRRTRRNRLPETAVLSPRVSEAEGRGNEPDPSFIIQVSVIFGANDDVLVLQHARRDRDVRRCIVPDNVV